MTHKAQKAPSLLRHRYTGFGVNRKGGGMREEIRLALAKKIAESFEKARGAEPPAPRKISEEERLARTARYADLLIQAAMRQSR
jgi:hypothetical protein